MDIALVVEVDMILFDVVDNYFEVVEDMARIVVADNYLVLVADIFLVVMMDILLVEVEDIALFLEEDIDLVVGGILLDNFYEENDALHVYDDVLHIFLDKFFNLGNNLYFDMFYNHLEYLLY